MTPPYHLLALSCACGGQPRRSLLMCGIRGRGPPIQVLPHSTAIVHRRRRRVSFTVSFSVSQIGFRRGGKWRGEGGRSCGGSRTAPAARCASPSGGAACSRKPTSSPCSATPRSLYEFSSVSRYVTSTALTSCFLYYDS
ncbi:unnamed protein product [Musa acuminata subsp. burmannicoides]